MVKGNPTLGAGVVNPKTNTITHIDIKSQPERHTINRAELAAIVVALQQENTEQHINILTDSSFCINTIRNYTIDPTAYTHHLHKDLRHLTNKLLKARDQKQLKTHIGKVKSHTDVEYNETTDKAARSVVNGDTLPEVTFAEAYPPIGGLRTWPQIRMKPTNKPDHIRKLTNLKTDIKKELGQTKNTSAPKGVYGKLLQTARNTGTDFSIHAYSQSPYRSRRDAYEVT